jgi:transposase
VLGLVRISGLSVKEAAAQHRLHPSTVNRWLRATEKDI